MKRHFLTLFIFFQGFVLSQNQVLKTEKGSPVISSSVVSFRSLSARDSILARAQTAILKRTSFGCQLDTVIVVFGNSQKLGYVPDEIPKFIALINGTKELCLEVKQLDDCFFSYHDTLNGLWGRFLVSHQPGEIIIYSEGKHMPKKLPKGKLKRLVIKVADLIGAIEFPVNGQAFLIITYAQRGDSVINNFQIFLETGHNMTNTYTNDLIQKKKYKKIAAKAIATALEQTLKKTAIDSLILSKPLR